MFDIGWSEMALIAVVSVVVIGPEDMPRMLYKLGKVTRKIKTFTGDIQKSLDNIVRDVEVDELAREVNENIAGPNLQFEIDRQIAEEEEAMEALEKDTPKEGGTGGLAP